MGLLFLAAVAARLDFRRGHRAQAARLPKQQADGLDAVSLIHHQF